MLPSKHALIIKHDGNLKLKDLFSTQAELYARYRPAYPQELYDYILSYVQQRGHALDCATGNGQVASTLAGDFRRVCAIDISESQLNHAPRLENIEYAVCRAEQTPFVDSSFDLITVAQAYHWFDCSRFYQEVRRIGRPHAIVAIWVYGLVHSEPPIDSIIHRWNFETLAPYWEEERKQVYSFYRDLPFEFQRIPAPEFQIVVEWTTEDLIGHLGTWSALQKMKRHVGDEPFQSVIAEIKRSWGRATRKTFTFPIVLHLGRVHAGAGS